jgi:hypothetical protein
MNGKEINETGSLLKRNAKRCQVGLSMEEICVSKFALLRRIKRAPGRSDVGNTAREIKAPRRHVDRTALRDRDNRDSAFATPAGIRAGISQSEGLR